MNNEFYTAAAGLLVQERRMEMISNNLANVSSTGYRAQRLFTESFAGLAEQTGVPGRANLSVTWSGAWEVPGRGALELTKRALDVALDDGQYLEVSTAAGPRYTRAGELRIDAGGTLVDAFDNPLIGFNGAPVANLPATARIAADATLIDRQDGQDVEVGRLRVVRAQREQLTREGSGLYSSAGRGPLPEVDTPVLLPGHLEGSGTDALGELVQLIDTQRAFESYQKLISLTMNEVNRRTVRDIAG